MASFLDFVDPLNLFHDRETTGGETVTAQPLLLPELQSLFSNFLPQFQPGQAFPGDFSALGQITPFEQLGLGTLQNFLQGTGTGPGFQQASNFLSGILDESFLDPNRNPLIQALNTQASSRFADILDQVKAERGAGSSFFTSETQDQELRAGQRFADNLGLTIANALLGLQRQQLPAAQALANLDKFQQFQVPLSQIGASQQFGGLQRTLDTAELEANYQDFVRQQNELAGVAGLAGGTQFGFQDFTSPLIQQPNPVFEGITSLINLFNTANSAGIFGGGSTGALRPSSVVPFQA